jgi:glycosyltransferase involved in cell wall biosynthesis
MICKQSDQAEPLVSIGLPVYNGEDFLEQSLDSILSQTYQNIEVIVADNASTDRTANIIEAYIQKDDRIKYYGSAENKGAAWNYNRTFEYASGKYFKWAAHDDVLHDEFVAECVRVLEQNPETVLCHSRVGQIDGDGVVQDHEYIKPENFLGPELSSYQRHRSLILDLGAWTRIFGVIRSDALQGGPLIASYVGSDLTLLGELGLKGAVTDIDKVLFWRREHSNTSTRGKYFVRRNRLVWFRSGKQPLVNFPSWKVHFELLRNIFMQEVSMLTKLRCSVSVIARTLRSWKELVEDVCYAGADIIVWLRSLLVKRYRGVEQQT